MRTYRLISALGIGSLLAIYYAPQAGFTEEAPPNTTKPSPSLKDFDVRNSIKFNFGFAADTQGAGTPNRIGPEIFLPISKSKSSFTFLDFEGFYTLPDTSVNSSIVNTLVSGRTFGTSTRLGYRWLNDDRSWMLGLNIGYDTLPVSNVSCAYGNCVNPNVYTENPSTAFFQQIALGAEAVSNKWRFTPSIALPIGNKEQKINSMYWAGALQNYYFEVGYNITPSLLLGAAYYYQNGDDNSADGSGALGRVSYEIFPNTTISASLSYDSAFGTRVSTGIRYRFNVGGSESKELKEWNAPQIKALSEHIQPNRVIRVHDGCKASTVDDGDCVSDPHHAEKRCVYTNGATYVTTLMGCDHFYQSHTVGRTLGGGAKCGLNASRGTYCHPIASSHTIQVDNDNG